MRYDVVVIGAGLAGLIAALKVLEQGKRAIVVSAGEGSLCYMSGYLDLCGHKDDPWSEIEKVAATRPGHPYSFLSRQEICEAIAFFSDEVAGECPYIVPIEFRNIRVPTPLGSWRPTYMIPQGQLAAVAAKEASQVLVVGFAGFRDFNAGILAAGMNRNRSYQWRSVEIDSGCRRPNPNSYDLAVYLDKMWPQVIDRLRPTVQNAKSVAFPAVMGLEKWRFIKQDMEECLGVPVFEVPTLPPSVPGVRLGGVLKKRVCQLNGEMLAGFPVRETIMNGQTCDAVVIDTPGRPRLLEGGKFILATGGIMGGGIVMGRERPAETVFGFPVAVPENSVDGRFFAPNGHGYARCGVRVNERLQPLDVDGQVLVDNIFCAGRILAGYDPFVEKDGAGVAIASGHKAALEALRR